MKRVGGSVVAAVVMWLVATAAMADFSVRQATARLQDGMYLVDAAIDFQFSDKALEALENGVPLTLVVEVTVQREGAWVWERNLARRELRYELRYHPLAGLYAVLDLDTQIHERFATREAAVTMLGELHSVEVIEQDRLDPDADYEMALRAYLDIESLPLPLQPLAYITPAWYLSTGWNRWRLRP